MTGWSEDCCAWAPRPVTSSAGAKTCATIDGSDFILNQMVQNQGRIQEIWGQQCNMMLSAATA